MKMSSVNELSKRLHSIQTEIEVRDRKRMEEAGKLVKALSAISKKDVEMLSNIVPELGVVVTYTEEQFLENKNGEVQMVQNVMNKLRTYLEQRLSFYEENL